MTTAFVFPGQGSQSLGMLSSSASEVRGTFDEASEALGYDLWTLTQNGPEDTLNQTEFTQPALLTASVALWRLWAAEGGSADFVAGHSLGEYSALVASGSISLTDGVRVVQRRGQLMQEAVPLGQGGMAAVMGLDDALIDSACQRACDSIADGTVQAANLNAPGQVVISGTLEALQQASAFCEQAGAKRVVPLNVSAPFHSRLMKPAAEALAEMLSSVTFSDPDIPIVQNVPAGAAESVEAMIDHLVTQLYSAVRWRESIEYLKQAGVDRVVECGPGKVLTGLNRRIDREIKVFNLDSSALLPELKDFV
ncbi:MAG: ACP S-malonyltransferase [Pseudomonadales bacterium]